MIKLLIGLLVALIVMVQVLYLERLKHYRIQLLLLFAIVLSGLLYLGLRDPVASFSAYVQQHHFALPEQKKPIIIDTSNKHYDQIFVEAMLAYQKEQPELALTYFANLYHIRPNDQTYYYEYADLLLTHDPRNPALAVILHTLNQQGDREPGLILLNARYEQFLGHHDKAETLFKEAVKAISTQQ